MRRVLAALVLMVLAAGVLVARGRPDPLMAPEGGWVLTVRDTDIDTALEIVDADTGYTPMPADTTLSVAFASQSRFDSLRAGNPGVGTLTAVFTGASTADATAGNNFLQDRNTGTVNNIDAVFSDGFSPLWNAYLTRTNDTDFHLGTTWAVAVFTGGFSAGNPGVSKPQTVYSLHTGSHQVRLEFLATTGYLAGFVSDDAGSTVDSLTHAVDVYDSTYHWAVFSLAASTLRLQVDGATARTKALSNAKSQLTLMDTLTLLGGRGGANDYRGRIDEFYLAESAAPFNADMELYAWRRLRAEQGAATDSAVVWVQGVRASDSTRVLAAVTAIPTGPVTGSMNLQDLEYAWLDTNEALPLIVFSTGPTVRGAKRDSIPAGELWNPVAHRYVPDDAPEVLRDVTVHQESSADTIWWEVRVYPNAEDARTPSVGYYLLTKLRTHANAPDLTRALDHLLPPYSYVAVYAKGSAANKVGSATLRGQRVR